MVDVMADRGKAFWLITVAAVLLTAVGVRLGVWQLDRAHQKEAWVAAIANQASRPALDNQGVAQVASQGSNSVVAEYVHRPVRLTGRWLPAHTVFLDNRQMNGRVGFYVVTPLQLVDVRGYETPLVVVVQRGWVPRDFLDRARVPEILTPGGPIEIVGRLAPPPTQLYSLGEAQPTRIRQNLDWSAYEKELGEPLGSYSVVQTGVMSEGLLREWPQVDAKIYTHYGYAAQWFALAALIFVLYIWFQWISPHRVKN